MWRERPLEAPRGATTAAADTHAGPERRLDRERQGRPGPRNVFCRVSVDAAGGFWGFLGFFWGFRGFSGHDIEVGTIPLELPSELCQPGDSTHLSTRCVKNARVTAW